MRGPAAVSLRSSCHEACGRVAALQHGVGLAKRGGAAAPCHAASGPEASAPAGSAGACSGPACCAPAPCSYACSGPASLPRCVHPGPVTAMPDAPLEGRTRRRLARGWHAGARKPPSSGNRTQGWGCLHRKCMPNRAGLPEGSAGCGLGGRPALHPAQRRSAAGGAVPAAIREHPWIHQLAVAGKWCSPPPPSSANPSPWCSSCRGDGPARGGRVLCERDDVSCMGR